MQHVTAISAEMRIPRPNLRDAVFTIAIVVFVGAAVFNLSRVRSTPLISLVASAAWLLLVFSAIATSCRSLGSYKQVAIRIGGMFAASHFIQLGHGENGTVVAFGYRLFWYSLYCLKVDARRIVSIGWSYGQASSMTGQDKNDWRVSLWYRVDDSEYNGLSDYLRGKGFFTIGPEVGPKESAENLGRAVVEFLENSGHKFAQTNQGRRMADLGGGDEYGLREVS